MAAEENRHARRREQSREKLEQAALELLAEMPYESIRIEDITARAGMSKGNLYLYYRSKDELYRTALRHSMFDPIERMFGELSSRSSDRSGILAEIVDYTLFGASREMDVDMLYRAMLDKAVMKLVVQDFREFYQRFMDLGEELFSSLDAERPRLRAMMLFMLLDGIGIYRLLELNGADFWKNEESMRDLRQEIKSLFGFPEIRK